MWTTYKEKIKGFSQKLIEAQKPIRIIDSIRWDVSILEKFKQSGFKEMPAVDPDFYQKTPCGFDLEKKKEELSALSNEIANEIGPSDPLARILIETCNEYSLSVDLIAARGTKDFYRLSKELFGCPNDRFFGSLSSVKDLGFHLYNILSGIAPGATILRSPVDKEIDAKDALSELNSRFERCFPGQGIKVTIDDEMLADASAMAKTIKLRQSATFTRRDLDILEVHEGWVHMGTTINGQEQRIAKWLQKGSPRVTATQEGLAVLMEIFSFTTFPQRARKINDRVLAIAKAEDGANFLEVFDYFRTEGYEESDCVNATYRVFRGGDVNGLYPFTKDIAYCKGFVENYNFIRACISARKSEMVPFLFVGKVHLTDVPALYQKFQEGIVDKPKYLPPFFANLDALIVWMSFSNFLSAAGMTSAQEGYRDLIQSST